MPDHGCGYDFFTEQELCNGVMNDRVVDGLHKKREPKHWRAKHSRTETKVVARKGIIARVDVQHAHDPNEPLVAGGHDLLEGLSPEERRALLDEAPPRALPPPPADVAPPAGGSLSFTSRASTGPESKGRGRAGQKRPRSDGKTKEGKKAAAPSGPLSFVEEDE
jgi:hypothetical protein